MDIPQDQVHQFICRNGHQFSRRSVYYATRVSLEIVVPSLFTKAPVAGFRQHWAVLDMATKATGEVNAFENPHFQVDYPSRRLRTVLLPIGSSADDTIWTLLSSTSTYSICAHPCAARRNALDNVVR